MNRKQRFKNRETSARLRATIDARKSANYVCSNCGAPDPGAKHWQQTHLPTLELILSGQPLGIFACAEKP